MKRSASTALTETTVPDDDKSSTKKCKQSTGSIDIAAPLARHRPALITKLISGGQTGADRAALEAAESLGVETGGWAPRKFITTRGETPELGTRFGLRELTEYDGLAVKGSTAQSLILRSRRNVDDSDGTLVFRLKDSPGTEKTIGYCQTRRWCYVAHQKLQKQSPPPASYRPYLVITSLSDCKNVTAIRDFIRLYSIRTLNVAGHRDEVVKGFSASIIALLTEALTVRV